MKDLEWAISTWHLFHFIGEKISDKFYIENKEEIINMIKTICYNLPCPDCAGHATYYLNRYRKYSLGIILNNFSIFYAKRYSSGIQLNLQSNQLTRKNITKRVNAWFKQHHKEFI